MNNVFYKPPEMKNSEEPNLANEGARMTGDTFLAMMENTALCPVPVGALCQSNGSPLTCPVVFVPFRRSFFTVYFVLSFNGSTPMCY
jgi:hypothetical protein